VDAGIREEHGRWRLAADPWIFSSSVPPAEIFGTPKAKLTLTCGSNDPMVKVQELRAFDPHAIELPGLGHNLHVEAPQVLTELVVERFLSLPASAAQVGR
jgi:pimeloyl-ACP methyl ester carboxylesterase